MTTTWRRIRAYAGHFGLLAVLSFTAALPFSALPRTAKEFTDRGLRADLGAVPPSSRDLTYRAAPAVSRMLPPEAAAARLSTIESALPAPLPGLVQDRWFTATVGPQDVQPAGPPPYAGTCRPEVQVRYQSGYAGALRLVSGRLPRPAATTEVLVNADAAGRGGLPAGSVLRLAAGPRSAAITVVGVFTPADPAAPYWAEVATVPVACPDPREGLTTRITLLTDLPGITRAGAGTGVLDYRWRYGLAVGRLRAADLTAVGTAVARARRAAPESATALSTGLDSALGRFEQRLLAVRALLAVVRAGLAAAVLGLTVLAAGLMTERRRTEFALLRARGAAVGTVAGRVLRETVVVVPAAVIAGWAVALLGPGRPDPGDWLLVVVAGLVALLAAPVLALRGTGDTGQRRDLVRGRPSARRLTVEVVIAGLAGLGVLLVRRRGLTATDGVDLYLVSVPVLLAVAAALLVVRVLPGPVRLIGRLTARARDVVLFLGPARAGRSPAVGAGPLAVLVVAIATGVFTASVSSTVSEARDRATDRATAADARIDGFAFAPGTARALRAVPGVEAVAPMLVQPGAALTAASGRRTQAQALVVDGIEAARVMTAGRVRVRLPDVLTAPPGPGPAPAVVSPEIAAEVGAGGTVEIQGRRYDFRVAAVTDTVPALPVGTRRFIALPWQALPVPGFQPIRPSGFLIAGSGFAPDALRAAGDEGQRADLSRVLGHPVTETALAERATVTTWDGHRAALGRGGVNGVLSFTYTAGAVGAAVLALLAMGLTVLADAPARGRTLSRLRTMGLSPRQGRHLLIHELTPPAVAAVLAGGLVGLLLPALLGPALGLSAFSAGVTGRTRLGPWLPVAAVLLLAAALGLAVLVESTANRRMRLGAVLRLGAED